jgi:hypothetical protein
VREGCIAETVSALQIAVAAERAADLGVAATLRQVADEELRHAELAWAFVAWVWARAGVRERSAIRAAFRDPAAAVPRGPRLATAVDDAVFEAHGLLPRRTQRALAARALRDIVAPASRKLQRGDGATGPGARSSSCA